MYLEIIGEHRWEDIIHYSKRRREENIYFSDALGDGSNEGFFSYTTIHTVKQKYSNKKTEDNNVSLF